MNRHLSQWHKAEDASKGNDEHEANVFAQVWLDHFLREDSWWLRQQVGGSWCIRSISLQVGCVVHA